MITRDQITDMSRRILRQRGLRVLVADNETLRSIPASEIERVERFDPRRIIGYYDENADRDRLREDAIYWCEILGVLK